jgi:hypothetical protein
LPRPVSVSVYAETSRLSDPPGKRIFRVLTSYPPLGVKCRPPQ